jgi:hypothetical protein
VHLPWLEEAQVESATTCDPGMNRRGDSLLTLRRFLDSSETSQLEFEAELSGFSELLRRGRALVQRLRGQDTRPEVASPPGSEVPPEVPESAPVGVAGAVG